VVVLTYLVDLLAPPFKLPDWVHELALTAHMGQPMVGAWDPMVSRCAWRWLSAGRWWVPGA
jgi:hypothetical protein